MDCFAPLAMTGEVGLSVAALAMTEAHLGARHCEVENRSNP